MTRVWAIRALLLPAVPLALAEADGAIPRLSARPALVVLVVVLALHFAAMARAARKR